MSSNEERMRKLITEQAADWFVANRAGLTAKERDAFAAWLKASPLHVEEYLAVSAVALDLPKACEHADGTIDALVARARLDEPNPVDALATNPVWRSEPADTRRSRRIAVTLAASVVPCAGILWWLFGGFAHVHPYRQEAALRFATGHGEQHTYQLADKSILHLNSATTVTVQFNGSERRVVLDAGEAVFEVAHDTNRAFRVSAGAAEVVSIGTEFDVSFRQDCTVITVVQGRIAVGPSMAGKRNNSDPLAPRFVDVVANQQVTVAAGEEPGEPVEVDAQRTTAWLHRQITFDHEPLEQVANEFNRYAVKPFRITTPALKKLEISGVFTTDDSAAFIAFLRSLDGVHVEESATQIRVFKD